MKTAPEFDYHDWKQRLLEILIGSMSWLFFLLIVVLSYFSVVWAAYVLIAYILLWLAKIIGYSNRMVRGFWRIQLSKRIDWQLRLKDLYDPAVALKRHQQRLRRSSMRIQRSPMQFYGRYLRQAYENRDQLLTPDKIYHAVIIAMYNEDPEILESTLQTIARCRYDKSRMFLIVAYEERGGERTAKYAKRLVKQYGTDYTLAKAIKHPADIPDEANGKAGNITYAARWLTKHIQSNAIDPEHVIVTTLDVDNRPVPQYFAETAYLYAITPKRVHHSYQPISMYFNNIWAAPAVIRIIAVSSSFWILMEALRPHRLRNFSAHGQSLQTLIDTDYWNVKSIVEDGHQYWRTYFTYKGDHKVLPIFSPVYQDAVLTDKYLGTFKAQFYQLRRWAWGVADTPYVIRRSFHEPDIPWSSKLIHIFRQIEGYFSWAVAPIILAVGGWLPLLIYADATDSALALQLPTIVSFIQTGALLGLLAPIISSLLSLPPRPPRYSPLRNLMMVLQWALIPVALIGFGSFAALNAQTRLLIGKYLSTFNVTEKKRRDKPPEV